jgi:hypothetical protein
MPSLPLRTCLAALALAGCQAIAGLDDFTDRADSGVAGSSVGGQDGGPSKGGANVGGASAGGSGTTGSGGATGGGGRSTGGAGLGGAASGGAAGAGGGTSGGATSGGASSGGASSGGATSGGAVGTGGVTMGTGGTCATGTKRCGSSCVQTDDPAYGCAATDCNPCPAVHATAVCTANACALGPCDANFANCDTDPSTGCEADLQNDPVHCGSCNKNCRAMPNAAPDNGCSQGMCQIDSRIGCKGGWLSCDNNPDNGCETQSSNAQCTDCGEPCPTGLTCQALSGIALCECTSNASCSWGGSGTCEQDPQEPALTTCHCDTLYCLAPGRCGDPQAGQTCRYF